MIQVLSGLILWVLGLSPVYRTENLGSGLVDSFHGYNFVAIVIQRDSNYVYCIASKNIKNIHVS